VAELKSDVTTISSSVSEMKTTITSLTS